MNEKEQNKNQNKKHYKRVIVGLAITTGVLGASTIGLSVAYGMAQSKATSYSTQLENVYKRNYYELVDSVNSTDTKISKLLASDSEQYQAKMLSEISQSAKEMQNNIATLPLSSDNIVQCVKFINQMAGYTQTLQEKLAKGGSLTETEIQTLSQMHDTLTEMKMYLNKMSENMLNGYNILESSSKMAGEYSSFSSDFAQINSSDADYPTMIYDGPFSDSVVNQKVKGLSGNGISKDEAYKKIDSIFKNITNINYQGDTAGKFDTYNYGVKTSDGQMIYVQVSKIGGHILTVSGNVDSTNKQISFEKAEKIAKDFAKANGVENASVVWSEELNAQAYFNIAPKQNDIILYPDLVKVKVDLEFGNVIGYDSVPYWTNHTNRNIAKVDTDVEKARTMINASFEVVGERLVLAPLEFNREVLCYEFECQRDGATYYIYINAETNIEENILKVVKTEDGSKLM